MKKIIAFILSVLMVLPAIFSMSVSAIEETEKVYTVTLYEDSSKNKVLLQKKNQKTDDKVYITFEPTKEGYSFVSWVDDATKENVTFTNNVIVVGESDAEYYIDWKINSYKLIYRGYNGIVEEFDVVYGTPADEMPVPQSVPEREGYEFAEWSALPETMPAGTTTITARWRDANLEAHFYVDYGDTTPFLSVPYLFDEPIFEPDLIPQKTGYSFAGWSFDGEKIVSGYDLGKMGNEDVNIYAVWTANKYNATFVANGGTFSDGSERKVIPVEYNTDIIFDEVPSKENFVFNGWTPAVGIMNNINGINFRATWIHVDDIYYTVNIHTMDTDGRYTSESKKYRGTVGSTVTADYTISEGFELNKTKGKLSGVVTTDCSLVLDVYIDRCLYDFCVNVDGVETVETYLYGETVPVPETPSKEGYTFLAWVPSLPSTMPSEDYTVTVVWTKNEEPHIHVEKDVTVEATCTENGKYYTVCEVCGVTMGEETILSAKGHTDSDWIVITEPTENTDGKKIKKCIICHETLEEEIMDKLSGSSKYNGIKIINNPGTVTLKYGEKLRVYAEVDKMYSGNLIKWSVSGEGAEIIGTGKNFCDIQALSNGTVMLTATLVDSDGEALRDDSGVKISDSQYINVKAGIFQKIIAFFRMLFGMNNIIVQTFKFK